MTRYRGCVCVGFLLVALSLPVAVWAQPGRDAVASGNRLYDEGRFEEAHEQYLEALREAVEAIHRAAEDPRVAGLIARIQIPAASPSSNTAWLVAGSSVQATASR